MDNSFWNKIEKYSMGEKGVYDLSNASIDELRDLFHMEAMTSEEKEYLDELYKQYNEELE